MNQQSGNTDNNNTVRTVLFITLSCVGDAVMTTPVLQALHLLYHDAVVDVVADKRSSILFSRFPYVGKILHKEKKKLLRGTFDLLNKLRGKRYDVIVDLRTDGLAYLMRGKRRFTKWQSRDYGPHAVEQFMGVISSIYGPQDLPAMKIWLDETHEKFADQQLLSLPAGRWLAVGPACGGAEVQKTWSASNYALLANSLSDLIAGVILLGSKDDAEMTAAISVNLELPFVDTAGKTDLLQVAAMIKRSAVFVGSDSGLGHIAAAMMTPTLSLFSVDKPDRCRPWGNKADWIVGPGQDARKIPADLVATRIRALINGAS